ncbi:YfiR family protein [Noviherbaspirillum saxi]|uniref:YfiR family protein n=2 Tax=Noviherbaspirillum saxi TaxID=2320863 RepID=A0A3A3FUT7_9BURK|nr:YfiR family protein [Noviherbaspirillum saxi]
MLPAMAIAQPVPEQDLKAAFVYNFVLFTDWPSDTTFEGNALNICIHANSAMRPAMAALNDRSIKGYRIAVRSLATLDNLRICHVLFVDSGDRERWTQIRKAVDGAPVLTVSDDEEIRLDGSIIALGAEGNRVVFDVDMRAARLARLGLSSKLLRLARTAQ